jgi:hypothetical protein
VQLSFIILVEELSVDGPRTDKDLIAEFHYAAGAAGDNQLIFVIHLENNTYIKFEI